jgi:Flp pilus assembly protein TadB
MTNQYFFARIAGRDRNLRAGDADRERVAERLRTGHAEGRLDTAELQERLERCYEAKTFGELGELVSDLPRQDEPAERRAVGWRQSQHWGLGRLVPILMVLFVLAALSSHHHVVLFWIPLLFIFWRLSWWRRRRWSAASRRGPDDSI